MESSTVSVELVDLRDYELPFCDGRHPLSSYGENAVKLDEKIKDADAYIFGMAVYCYSISGVFKNFIDICCGGMSNKPFGIVAASGGTMSYMAVEDLQKMSREFIIMFKILHEVCENFEAKEGDNIPNNLTKSINVVIAQNAQYLPDLFTSFKNLQQQKLLESVVKNDD